MTYTFSKPFKILMLANPVADLRGRSGRPAPRGPIFFNFMPFSGLIIYYRSHVSLLNLLMHKITYIKEIGYVVLCQSMVYIKTYSIIILDTERFFRFLVVHVCVKLRCTHMGKETAVTLEEIRL